MLGSNFCDTCVSLRKSTISSMKDYMKQQLKMTLEKHKVEALNESIFLKNVREPGKIKESGAFVHLTMDFAEIITFG